MPQLLILEHSCSQILHIPIIKMKTNFTPISAKEFREVAKGYGIKYRNKILSKELEAMLGYRLLDRGRKVEVSVETGF